MRKLVTGGLVIVLLFVGVSLTLSSCGETTQESKPMVLTHPILPGAGYVVYAESFGGPTLTFDKATADFNQKMFRFDITGTTDPKGQMVTEFYNNCSVSIMWVTYSYDEAKGYEYKETVDLAQTQSTFSSFTDKYPKAHTYTFLSNCPI